MTDDVDTTVDPVESTHARGLGHGVPPVAQFLELASRDHPVLPRRQLGERSVPNP